MTDSGPPAIRSEEPTPVQLTRMEGKLDLVAYQLTNLNQRVDKHEGEIGTLKSEGQRLSEQAVARDATAVALAAALKEAEANRRTKSEQTWTPFQRGIAVLGAIATAIAIYSILTPL